MKPDLILMDIRLPGIDGLSLTRTIKEHPELSDIPIVMMSGDSCRETLVVSMAAGAAAFVVEPVSRAALQARLDKEMPR